MTYLFISGPSENYVHLTVFEKNRSWCVVNNPVNPLNIAPDSGVDTRVVLISTANTPGDNALKVAIADKGAPGVALWSTTTNQDCFLIIEHFTFTLKWKMLNIIKMTLKLYVNHHWLKYIL